MTAPLTYGAPDLKPLHELAPEMQELVARARDVARHAYNPYSHYAVGAAVRGESGRVYAGCNVENASYGATICAERAAIFAMVAAGERRLHAVAVFAPNEPLAMPCGLCRQVIAEFCAEASVVVAADGGALERRFSQLLPEAFRLGGSA